MIEIDKIFGIKTGKEFEELALEIFRFQAKENPVYSQYVKYLGVDVEKVDSIYKIPFLPIEFFKTKRIITRYYDLPDNRFTIFTSSGTTGLVRSKHFVYDIGIYEKSFYLAFKEFVADPSELTIFALLPSYLEQKNSSLVYMVNFLIDKALEGSGFFLYNYGELYEKIMEAMDTGRKILLFGVSYALWEFAEKYPFNTIYNNIIVLETGGMKGRRREITRQELHAILKQGFKTERIGSEYGMTELLSQSYSSGDGIFSSPKWKKILIRDINDPFTYLPKGRIGGVNIIDLANVYSCSFIETKDLGKIGNGGFEILGRFDNSDIRGCNLLV